MCGAPLRQLGRLSDWEGGAGGHCLLWPVRLLAAPLRSVVGGRGFVGGPEPGPGGGGAGGEAGGCSWSSSSVGIVAGFNRSIEILSEAPPGNAILKELSRLSRIL